MLNKLFGKSPNLLVVGDLMLDHYLWGSCERISPEAPVQVVDIKNETTLLGGAGNVISNLVSLGAKVCVASVVGEDENGDKIESILKDKNIKTDSLIRQKDRKTSKKSRVMASHQQVVRFDKESKEPISASSEELLLKLVENELREAEALLLSDYGKGVLTPNLTQKIITLANEKNIPTLIDPKGSDYSKYKNATLITPNKAEASMATGIKIEDEESLKKAGEFLKNDLNLKYAIITLSEDGMAIFQDAPMKKIDTVAREVYDVTGAGDTVLATLGFALGCKLEIEEAAMFATLAAGVVVGKLGSATTTLEEISKYKNSKRFSKDKIVKSHDLKEFLSTKKDSKTVFTNGCFDILHAGHVSYLERAKSYGDLLIVGLNSDSSVRELKGESRPINSEDDRALILASLEFVDFVVIFSEQTPYELIKELKPNVLVKGADYKDKEVVGSDLVDEVHLIDFLEGRSTTKIIEKVKK